MLGVCETSSHFLSVSYGVESMHFVIIFSTIKRDLESQLKELDANKNASNNVVPQFQYSIKNVLLQYMSIKTLRFVLVQRSSRSTKRIV